MGKLFYFGKFIQNTAIMAYAIGTTTAKAQLDKLSKMENPSEAEKKMRRTNYVIFNLLSQMFLLTLLTLGTRMTDRTTRAISNRCFGIGALAAVTPQLLNLLFRSDHLALRYRHYDDDRVQQEHIHCVVQWALLAAPLAISSLKLRHVLGLSIGFAMGDRALFNLAPKNYLGAIGS